MALDPTDYKTWTALGDHPIFGDSKFRIEEWSHDPSCYCELDSYKEFNLDWYVPVDPAPPADQQLEIANRDIAYLRSTCSQIERLYGTIKHEMVILDDYTVYVWARTAQFSIEIYSINFLDDDVVLRLFIDRPDVAECEHECRSVEDLINALQQTLGMPA